jgi:CheY-like chemotaxis protein
VALEARLIDDLLDLTAIRTGKVSLRHEVVDMHALVRAVVAMVDESIAAKSLRVELELQAPQPLVLGDQARLQQVLWNLVRNAVKFTPNGGRIVLHTANDGGDLLVTCTDSGIGIEPSALPRIFRAFEQADGEVASHYGGLGLGLAIAQGLVAEHGGTIVASSAGRDQGASFVVRLASHALEPFAAPPEPVPVPVQEPEAGGRRRILLVEDNEDAAITLTMCLEEYGYVVECVGTVSAAVSAGASGRFDAVVTDLGLPDGSGIEVGRALSGRVPVVALSGYGADQDLQQSSDAGFALHLVKPVDPADVHAALQQLLASETA